MRLPRFHSCTWSDEEQAKHAQRDLHRPARESPGSLADKELHLWVTYPAVKQAKRKGNRTKSRREALKLWAVVIIEALQQTDAFTYEVTLKRIFKREDRTIKVWVSNDPDDQSDEANVIGFVSPPATLLTSLEQSLSQVAAKRVYDAIVQTWSYGDVSDTKSSVIRLPMQRCPEGADGAATVLACGPTSLDEQRNVCAAVRKEGYDGTDQG
jgi:hypothetical protein